MKKKYTLSSYLWDSHSFGVSVGDQRKLWNVRNPQDIRDPKSRDSQQFPFSGQHPVSRKADQSPQSHGNPSFKSLQSWQSQSSREIECRFALSCLSTLNSFCCLSPGDSGHFPEKSSLPGVASQVWEVSGDAQSRNCLAVVSQWSYVLMGWSVISFGLPTLLWQMLSEFFGWKIASRLFHSLRNASNFEQKHPIPPSPFLLSNLWCLGSNLMFCGKYY